MRTDSAHSSAVLLMRLILYVHGYSCRKGSYLSGCRCACMSNHKKCRHNRWYSQLFNCCTLTPLLETAKITSGHRWFRCMFTFVFHVTLYALAHYTTSVDSWAVAFALWADSASQLIESQQDTPPSNRNKPNYVLFGNTVHIQTPTTRMSPGKIPSHAPQHVGDKSTCISEFCTKLAKIIRSLPWIRGVSDLITKVLI